MVRIQRPPKKKKQESLARRLFAAGAAGVTMLTGGTLGLRSAGAVKPPVAQVRLRTDLAAGAGRTPGAGAAGITVAEEARIKAETERFLGELRRVAQGSEQRKSFLARLLNISPAQAEVEGTQLTETIQELYQTGGLEEAVREAIVEGGFTAEQAAEALLSAGISPEAVEQIALNLGATPEQAAVYAQPSYVPSAEADAYVPPSVLPAAPVAPITPPPVVEPGPPVLPGAPSAATIQGGPTPPSPIIRIIDEERGIAQVAMPGQSVPPAIAGAWAPRFPGDTPPPLPDLVVPSGEERRAVIAGEESIPTPERTVQTDGGTFIITPSGAVLDADRNPTPYTVDPSGQVFMEGAAVPIGHVELRSPGIEEVPREVFVPTPPPAPAEPVPAPLPPPVTIIEYGGERYRVPLEGGAISTETGAPTPYRFEFEAGKLGMGRIMGPAGEEVGRITDGQFVPAGAPLTTAPTPGQPPAEGLAIGSPDWQVLSPGLPGLINVDRQGNFKLPDDASLGEFAGATGRVDRGTLNYTVISRTGETRSGNMRAEGWIIAAVAPIPPAQPAPQPVPVTIIEYGGERYRVPLDGSATITTESGEATPYRFEFEPGRAGEGRVVGPAGEEVGRIRDGAFVPATHAPTPGTAVEIGPPVWQVIHPAVPGLINIDASGNFRLPLNPIFGEFSGATGHVDRDTLRYTIMSPRGTEKHGDIRAEGWIIAAVSPVGPDTPVGTQVQVGDRTFVAPPGAGFATVDSQPTQYYVEAAGPDGTRQVRYDGPAGEPIGTVSGSVFTPRPEVATPPPVPSAPPISAIRAIAPRSFINAGENVGITSIFRLERPISSFEYRVDLPSGFTYVPGTAILRGVTVDVEPRIERRPDGGFTVNFILSGVPEGGNEFNFQIRSPEHAYGEHFAIPSSIIAAGARVEAEPVRVQTAVKPQFVYTEQFPPRELPRATTAAATTNLEPGRTTVATVSFRTAQAFPAANLKLSIGQGLEVVPGTIRLDGRPVAFVPGSTTALSLGDLAAGDHTVTFEMFWQSFNPGVVAATIVPTLQLAAADIALPRLEIGFRPVFTPAAPSAVGPATRRGQHPSVPGVEFSIDAAGNFQLPASYGLGELSGARGRLDPQTLNYVLTSPVTGGRHEGNAAREGWVLTPVGQQPPAQPVAPAAPSGSTLQLTLEGKIYTVRPDGTIVGPAGEVVSYVIEQVAGGGFRLHEGGRDGPVVFTIDAKGEVRNPAGEAVGGLVAEGERLVEYVSGRADYYIRRAGRGGQSDAATIGELVRAGIEPDRIATAALKEWNNDALRVVRAAAGAGASAEAIREALSAKTLTTPQGEQNAFTVAVGQAVAAAAQRTGAERVQGMGELARFLRESGMSAQETAQKLQQAGFHDDPRDVLRLAGYTYEGASATGPVAPSQLRAVNVEGRWLVLYPDGRVREVAAARPSPVGAESLYLQEGSVRFGPAAFPLQETPFREMDIADENLFRLYQAKFQTDGLDRSGATAETFRRAIAAWGSNPARILRAANLAGLTNVEIIQGLDAADQAARVSGSPTRYLEEGILAAIALARDQSVEVKEANRQAIITAIRDAALTRERLDELVQYLAPRLNVSESQLREQLGILTGTPRRQLAAPVAPSPTTVSPIAGGFVKAGGGSVNPFVDPASSEHLPQLNFFGAFTTSSMATTTLTTTAPILFSGDNVLQASSVDQITFRWAKVPGAESYWYSSDLTRIANTNSYSWVRLDDQTGIIDRGDTYELTLPASTFPAGEHWFQITAGSANNRADWARSDTGYPFRFVRLRIHLATSAMLRVIPRPGPITTLAPIQSIWLSNETTGNAIIAYATFAFRNEGSHPISISGFTMKIAAPPGFQVLPEARLTNFSVRGLPVARYDHLPDGSLRFSLLTPFALQPGDERSVFGNMALVQDTAVPAKASSSPVGGAISVVLTGVEVLDEEIGSQQPVVISESLIVPADYEVVSNGTYDVLDVQVVDKLARLSWSPQDVIDFLINRWHADFSRIVRAAMRTNLPISDIIRTFRQQGYLRQIVQAALVQGADPGAVLRALREADISFEELHQLQGYFRVSDATFHDLLAQSGLDADAYESTVVHTEGFHLASDSYYGWSRNPEMDQQYRRIVLKAVYLVPQGKQPQQNWYEGMNVLMEEAARLYERELRGSVAVEFNVFPVAVAGEQSNPNYDYEHSENATTEVIRRLFRQRGDHYDPNFSQRQPDDYDVVVTFIEGGGGAAGWGLFRENSFNSQRDDIPRGSIFGAASVATHPDGLSSIAARYRERRRELPFLFYVTLHEVGHTLGLPHAWEVIENPVGAELDGGFHNVVGHVMSYSSAEIAPEAYFIPDSLINLLVGRPSLSAPLSPPTLHADPAPPARDARLTLQDNIIAYINTESTVRRVSDALILRALLGSGIGVKDIVDAFRTASGGGIGRLIRAARGAGIAPEDIIVTLWQQGFTLPQLKTAVVREALNYGIDNTRYQYVDPEEVLQRRNLIAPSPSEFLGRG